MGGISSSHAMPMPKRSVSVRLNCVRRTRAAPVGVACVGFLFGAHSSAITSSMISECEIFSPFGESTLH